MSRPFKGEVGASRDTYSKRKIAQYLRDGMTESKIREWIMDNWEDCTTVKEANKWLDAGYEWIAPSPEEDKETKDAARKRMEETLQDIIENSRINGYNKAALIAMDQLAKIQGLYTNKIQADINEEISFNFGE